MTENVTKFIASGIFYKELAGKSTETKPVDGIAQGSWYHEVDTKKVYSFDGEEWVEQLTLGGDDE